MKVDPTDEYIEQLKSLRAHCAEMEVGHEDEEDDNVWTADVAALDYAINVLEEIKRGNSR